MYRIIVRPALVHRLLDIGSAQLQEAVFKGGLPENAELLLGVTRMAMIKKKTFQGERQNLDGSVSR